MGFVFKLLKELNSSENEKFITLAIVMGLISGFLPFFNIFTLIVLFFAFFLRIPFGLYLASWGVFSIVGYFLDPLFAYSGYAVLSAPFLSSLWDLLYNIPLMRWSGFNNTVVMGGLIWGLVFGAVIYFLLNKSIKLYREKFFSFCLKYKFLKWIVPNEIKKKSAVRISGVISFIVLFGGIFLFVSLTFDPFVKVVTEYVLSKTLRKPVKIEKLQTSFFKADIKMQNIYIGNVKTDKAEIKLSWYYLLWRKFDIQKLIIKNIHTDVSLKQIVLSNKSKTAKKSVKNKFNIKLPNPKDLLADYQLESVQKIKKLKKDYSDFLNYVKQVKQNIQKEKAEIDKIKQDIAGLQKTAGSVKSLNDIQNVLSKTEQIKKEVKNLQESIKNDKNRLSVMKKQILNDLDEVKKAGKNDYAKLSRKYDLLKEGKYFKFAETFLKPQIQMYVNQALKYYELVKPYITKKQKNRYVRSKGLYIKFKDNILYPDFVLEKADATASLKDAGFTVIMKNISSNQKLLSKKAYIYVNSKSKYYQEGHLDISYLNKIDLNYALNRLVLKNLKYKTFFFKQLTVNMDGNGYINGDNLNIKTRISALPEGIEYTSGKKFNSILKAIKTIDINIKVNGKINKFNVAVNSNIDNVFSKILKNEINRQIALKKSELNSLINKKLKTELSNSGVDMKQFGILDNLNSLDGTLKNLKDSLKTYSKKELEKKLLKKGVGNFLNF